MCIKEGQVNPAFRTFNLKLTKTHESNSHSNVRRESPVHLRGLSCEPERGFVP